MADAADSKSVGLKTVRVQVPPPAQKESPESSRSQGFFSRKGQTAAIRQKNRFLTKLSTEPSPMARNITIPLTMILFFLSLIDRRLCGIIPSISQKRDNDHRIRCGRRSCGRGIFCISQPRCLAERDNQLEERKNGA